MRLVIAWHRVNGDLPAAVAQRDPRLAFRANTFGNGELVVQPGQSRRAGEDQLSIRHRRNVKVGDLIEAACEQSPCGIVRQRLTLNASGEQNANGEVARPYEQSGWTQRQR